MDIYQERYLKHQERKKRIIAGEESELPIPFDKELIAPFSQICINRKSRRIFSGKEIARHDFNLLLKFSEFCPSSCDRQPISLQVIEDKEEIQLLETLLVGGVNWCSKANKIILLWADMLAYKSPNEIDFMPYLDAGVKIQQLYLSCAVLGIKCCYINPNIREENKQAFIDKFGDKKFAGAFAIGK